MLAKRIIPCLDINKGRVVKGVNFIDLRDAGDPVKNAQFYQNEGADELVFLDITASFERRATTVKLVKKVAEVIFMPFTVGGGIRTIDDIRALLLAGADKVSLNTIAVNKPDLIKQASKVFGSQCIVVAIDAKKKATSYKLQATRKKSKKSMKPEACSLQPDMWEVYIHGGRTPTGLDVVEWAKTAQKLGAGEILLTSMDFDGTKDGYDIELTKAVGEAVSIPVIASGGAGTQKHFADVFTHTRASAALAASIFHFKQYRVSEIKKYLDTNNVMVRS